MSTASDATKTGKLRLGGSNLAGAVATALSFQVFFHGSTYIDTLYTELSTATLMIWATKQSFALNLIQPGKQQQNAYVARYNSKRWVGRPRRHRCAMVAGVEAPLRRGASMGEVSIIGLDLAKNVFQAHGAGADGSVIFRRKLSRAQLLKFMAAQSPCVVAMEACASSHHWSRAIGSLGHEVRLIPPAYVKPFVKRQKNDMADAEAIAEAASRPTMRFVAVKSEAQQAAAMAYRTRDLLVRQRTQTINALRAHLAEFGITARVGRLGLDRLLLVGLPHAVSPAREPAQRAAAGVHDHPVAGVGGGRLGARCVHQPAFRG